MPQVFANDMVAHVWANQSQESGRSHNGNYSFEGRTLYSYSTAIARLVDTKQGGRAALVTSRTYSMTTSGKHMPPIWRALRDGVPSFRVPFVSAMSADSHGMNLAYLVEQYREAEKRLRGRGRVWGDIGERLRSPWAAACDYAESFGVPLPDGFPLTFADVDAIAAEIAQFRAERDAKNNTPEAIAKREAEAVKRAERKERKEREARRLASLKDSERRAEWQAGAAINYHGRTPNGGAYLRVKGDKLETSQGASVPLADAIQVFRFVKLCRDKGQAWQRNGARVRVGHFQLDSVAPSGDFIAGCHRIEWAEIVSAATQAGVLDLAPSAEIVSHD